MDVRLVVVRPFGSHAKGDVLSSPADVMKILTSEDVCNVVRVGVPAMPSDVSKPISPGSDKAKES